MAHRFETLERKMSPERLARSKARAKSIMADMLISEIRKEVGLTQGELAENLGITQPSMSKLESQDDMQVSTLRRIVHALGGDLEIVAHLPSGDIRLSQFKD
jgi:transcriptional regulator with XRE-family HTH domain